MYVLVFTSLLIFVYFFTSLANAQNLPINWASGNQGTLIDGMNSLVSASGPWTIFYGVPTSKIANSIRINNTPGDFVEGNGSISITAPPNATTGYTEGLERAINKNFNNAANFYFWFHIKNVANLNGSGEGVSFQLTGNNWLSHFSCNIDTAGLQDGWNPIVVARSSCIPINSPSWASNITSIQFRVELNSSVAPTKNVTVNFDNLRENYGGGVFNKAQVILTFDGSWNSTLYNATPILVSNHQSGVAFIVTNQIGENQSTMSEHDYAYDCGMSTNGNAIPCISANQIKTLYNDGWDISSHTVNHADLVTRTSDDFPIPGMINDNFELANSFSSLKALGFAGSARFFAYPNGAYNSIVVGSIQNQGNYIFARALGEGIDQPNLYPQDPYNLSYRAQSTPVTPSITPAEVEDEINQIIPENGLLILTFHIIQKNTCTNLASYTSYASAGYKSELTYCENTSVEYSTGNLTIISNYLALKQSEGLLKVTNLTTYYDSLTGTTSVTTTTILTSSTTTVPATSSTTSTSTSTTSTSTSTTSTTITSTAPTTTIPPTSTSTTTSTTTLSTTTAPTTTISSSCSGTPSLTLSPTTAAKSSIVKATVSGMSGCGGATITIKDYEGCTSGVTLGSFTSNGVGGNVNLISPSANGTYGYYACINSMNSTKDILTVN